MGLFKKAKIAPVDLKKLQADKYLSGILDVSVRKEPLTIGRRICDGLIKPISTEIMPSNLFDGDVEGIDVDPSEK